jgi:hypothetical protein
LIISTVERIYLEHPTTKIVLGEVTPCHKLDKEILSCNTHLRERFRGESIQLVSWDYLRDDDWSYFKPDKKHIKVSATPFFAGGYIAALQRAHNLPQKKHRTNNDHRNRDSDGRGYQQSATGYDNATPLMQNMILSHNVNQPTNNQPNRTSAPTYHSVPPPPAEPQRYQNMSSTQGTYPVLRPNKSISTSYRTPSPPSPPVQPSQFQFPINHCNDGNANRSDIGDRLKRIAYPPIVQNEKDKRGLVEALSGMKAWS